MSSTASTASGSTGKGDQLRKDAWELLNNAKGINFIGNVEGRDLMTGDVDVVVTDGFTGNVTLKTLEGTLKTVIASLFEAFAQPEYKDAAKELLPALMPMYATFDPDEVGGAILLGVDGVCIISHGSSSAKAMLNGIKVAADMVQCDMVGALRQAISTSLAE